MYCYSSVTFILIESTCPIPPTYENSVIVEFVVAAETFVTYQCVTVDFMFRDRTRRKTYECINSVWTEPLLDCAGKFAGLSLMRAWSFITPM